MTGLMLVKSGMIRRVNAFLAANPLGYAEGDEVVARLGQKVARLNALEVQQESGLQSSRSSAIHRRELRRAITRITLFHVLRVAKLLAPDHPGEAGGIQRPPPGRGEQSFLTRVQAIVQEVEAHLDAFLHAGLSPEGLAELKQQLATYKQAMLDAHAARRAHTGARAELEQQIRELMRMVQVMDGIVGLRFRDKPELMGAWKSARNVAWPVEESKPSEAA